MAGWRVSRLLSDESDRRALRGRATERVREITDDTVEAFRSTTDEVADDLLARARARRVATGRTRGWLLGSATELDGADRSEALDHCDEVSRVLERLRHDSDGPCERSAMLAEPASLG